MLLDLYEEYRSSSGVVSLPGFKAFVLKKYPDEYGTLVESFMQRDKDFDKVCVLIEGYIVDSDLVGDLNSKAVDRVLKKYHGYDSDVSELTTETKRGLSDFYQDVTDE